jgi:ATP-dependent RNA helicase DeaD
MEERPLPDDEELERVVTERITALLESELRSRDNLQIERMQRFLPLSRNLAQSEDELALIAMLLDDYYQKSLHAPPEQPSAENDQAIVPKPKPNNKRPRPPRNRTERK